MTGGWKHPAGKQHKAVALCVCSAAGYKVKLKHWKTCRQVQFQARQATTRFTANHTPWAHSFIHSLVQPCVRLLVSLSAELHKNCFTDSTRLPDPRILSPLSLKLQDFSFIPTLGRDNFIVTLMQYIIHISKNVQKLELYWFLRGCCISFT